jgi:hypothetical protein
MAKEARMSRYYGIGDAAKKLHAKLTDSLAGPLQQYLPSEWIDQTLREIGYRFRQTAFSPCGDVVGVPWPGA